MRSLDHPNVIRLFETWEDTKNQYLVMELCAGGGLVNFVKKSGGYFEEPQVACLMRQLLRTVSYMHKKGICHRDLKPENFLLLTKEPIERNILKIIDFGVSTRFEQGQILRDKAGTPFYTSPQVLDGRYTQACDLWSCGVIMYILLSGRPPFSGSTDEEVWGKIRRGNFAFQYEQFHKVSEDAKNIMRGLMKYKEVERFTGYEALHHDAIQRYAPRGKDVKIQNSIITNLRDFAFSTKLKKAALHAVVHTGREDQVAMLRETFLALDIDDDGFVTKDEFSSALVEAGLEPPADLEDILTEVDVSGSGEIDYTEFIAATMDATQYLREDRCWAAFLLFDNNGDGKICKEELECILGDPDIDRDGDVQLQAVTEVLSEADVNGDGAIDYEEFLQMMKKGCNFEPQTGTVIKEKPRKHRTEYKVAAPNGETDINKSERRRSWTEGDVNNDHENSV
jgi:calcium-dependent protein kinase